MLWGEDQCDNREITELACDAVDRGDISHDEVDELLSADIIIKGLEAVADSVGNGMQS